MNKCLIVSFDLIKDGEPEKSLSIASLMAYAKSNRFYGVNFQMDHLSINQYNAPNLSMMEVYMQLLLKNMDQYTHLALSCFVWNEYLINPLIHQLKHSGYMGKIILGGAQITYGDRTQLTFDYPGADYFISSYGEESIVKILKNEIEKGCNYLSSKPDFSLLPSPYLSKEIEIINGHKLRWETKRGCPYKCSFCAHRNLENGKVNYMNIEKSVAELFLFKEKGVKKINVLDPIFNMGKEYLEIMRTISALNFESTQFSFQSKIELLNRPDGELFLDLAEKTNSHLEFGLQTIIEEEYKVIDRKNDIKIIDKQLDILNRRGISYEVSLIYGLPNQTPDSFRRGIEFLKEKGCKKISAWPLMLLKGTPLYYDHEKWNLKEEVIGDYYIPVVTSSNSFSKDDWYVMKDIADQLMTKDRVL